VSRDWQLVVVAAVLLGASVAQGMQIARQSQEIRAAYAQLQQNQQQQDRLLAEHSRLLLERAALASYNSVDRLAEYELNMRFPETITKVLREVHR
jgi:cell division protein FtsL